MTVYLDSEFIASSVAKPGSIEVDVPFLDGMCSGYVEGFRYVPLGYTWTRKDGVSFNGPMFSPCRDTRISDNAQKQYEEDLEDLAALIEEIYSEDLEQIEGD